MKRRKLLDKTQQAIELRMRKSYGISLFAVVFPTQCVILSLVFIASSLLISLSGLTKDLLIEL
jgi:hypothetical protein